MHCPTSRVLKKWNMLEATLTNAIWFFLIFLIVSFHPQAAVGNDYSIQAGLNVAGQWSVVEETIEENCGEGLKTIEYTVTVDQDGNELTIDTPYKTITAYLDQYSATWDGIYYEDGGSGSTTGEITFNANGTGFEGTEEWTWGNGSFECSGVSWHTGTRISDSSADDNQSSDTDGGDDGGSSSGCFMDQLMFSSIRH